MITAPFNFVPLSDKVFFPNWSEQVSHDIPFEDGEDGIITLEITNHTPMFVRDGHAKGQETDWSCHIVEAGQKKYFIPGTTLKGCFRSVFEILSFSKMNYFDDASFGYRSFGRGVNDQYQQNISRVKYCGWLFRDDNEHYYIEECAKGIQKIRHYDIFKYVFPTFNAGQDHCTAEIKQRSLDEDLYPSITIEDNQIFYKENNNEKKVPAGTYKVVCTGYMNGKKTEYLFSVEESPKKLTVSNEVFKIFDSVHSVTPFYAGTGKEEGFLKKRLKDGEKIPVFFEKNEQTGDVVTMGITRMFKYPFKSSVKQCVERVSKDHFDTRLDLTETVFGYTNTDKDRQLRGRVQFGHAFATALISDEACVTVKGVLGQPKASYYPLYLKQQGNAYRNYNSEDAQIAGRKRYRITKDAKTWNPGTGNDNEAVMTQFKLLPKAQTFVCKVRIHNLRKMEIGALLSAFTFNETKGTYHNLGLAKSFGFGCFTCKVKLSDDFQFTAEEYVSEFNAEMSCFLQKKDSILAQDESLKRLVEIASATHTQEEMAQMDLDGYRQHKSDRDFSVLKETNNKEFNVLVDEKEIVVKHLRQNIEQQIKRLEQLPHQEAIDKLSALRLELAGMGLDDLREKLQEKIGWHIHKMGEAVLCQMQEFTHLPHQEAKEKLNGLLNDYSNKGIDEVLNQIQQEIDKHNDAITKENQNRRLEAGLSFLLELKADRSELKLSNFSEGVKRIGQFLKKNTGYTLVPNDDNVLQTWLHTIPVPTKKKDVAEFVSFESNSWKLIRTWVGEDKANQWFETATAR